MHVIYATVIDLVIKRTSTQNLCLHLNVNQRGFIFAKMLRLNMQLLKLYFARVIVIVLYLLYAFPADLWCVKLQSKIVNHKCEAIFILQGKTYSGPGIPFWEIFNTCIHCFFL